MDKTSSVYKTVLLGVVCSVAGACLAAVNAITKPVIDENAIAAVKSTLSQFYPDGTFTDVTTKYVTSETDLVDGVYEAEGKGYIFTLHNTGYSSSGFKFAIAFNNDGTIAGYMVLEQNETAGKGSLAFDDDYANQVKALTSTDAMPLISGATITTSAVATAVGQAETIFNQIAGIEGGAAAPSTPAPTEATKDTLGTGDYSKAKASCTESSAGVYACKAVGFSGSEVSATITVKDGAVVSIDDLTGKDDGDGMGDDWYSDASIFKGATLDSSIDAMSGATFTSDAVKGMVAAALKGTTDATTTPASTNTLGTENYDKAKATCTASSEGVYACQAVGFSSAAINATITVKDGAIVSIDDLKGEDDGDGMGDDWYSDASIFKGATLDSSIDAMSGATFTSNAVKGMAAAALNAAKQ